MSEAADKPTESKFLGALPPRPKRARSKFYVRHFIPSDEHPFVGRIYDLGIVQHHFDTYEEMLSHPDSCYLSYTSGSLISLTGRIESLNLVGDLLWPEPLPKSFKGMPVSRYEWLTLATDVFLMRYISVVDCALILADTVFEYDTPLQKCTLSKLRKQGLPPAIIDILDQNRF